MRALLLSLCLLPLAACAAPNPMAAANAEQERQAENMAGRPAPPPWSLSHPGAIAPGWGGQYGGFIFQRH